MVCINLNVYATTLMCIMFLNPKLFVLSHEELRTIGFENLTYGSLTDKGTADLATALRALMGPCDIQGLDLGCGDGELLYQLEQTLEGSVWHGVEISESRVDCQTRDVCIWQGDMLAENFRAYNVLHADNLCLDEATAERLEQKIAAEFQGIYISYRVPEFLGFLKRARLAASVSVEATWGLHTIYLYCID